MTNTFDPIDGLIADKVICKVCKKPFFKIRFIRATPKIYCSKECSIKAGHQKQKERSRPILPQLIKLSDNIS